MTMPVWFTQGEGEYKWSFPSYEYLNYTPYHIIRNIMSNTYKGKYSSLKAVLQMVHLFHLWAPEFWLQKLVKRVMSREQYWEKTFNLELT